MSDIIDRDNPCRCGALVARELRDGCLECLYCDRVDKPGLVATHE